MSAQTEYTPSKPAKAPKPEEARIFTESYHGVRNGVEIGGLVKDDVNKGMGRSTVHRIRIQGPDGQQATVFMSLRWTGKGWRAELDHDATDYSTDTASNRTASVSLRFFKP